LEFWRDGGAIRDLENLIGVQQVLDAEAALALNDVVLVDAGVRGSIVEQPIPDGTSI
jgi:hypothetical protein